MGVEVGINTKGMVKVARRLAKHQPAIFYTYISKAILTTVASITVRSGQRASQQARWLGNYAGGFRYTRIRGTYNSPFAVAYNIHGYSIVIEHGASVWKRMPPVDAISWWARGKLGLDDKSARQFAIAYGLALQGKGRSRTATNALMNQARKGLRIMTIATKRVLPKVRKTFKRDLHTAVRILAMKGHKI